MDKKYIINLQGNNFVKFEGLLSEFHNNGGKSIETEELEKSTFETPMFKATVSGEKGTFTGHGDANNSNVNSMISKHKYRMAETRAIARALRWYNNIGECSFDELGGDDVADNVKKVFPEAKEFNPVVSSVADENKQWIDDDTFKTEIGAMLKNGSINTNTPADDVMKLLRAKYKVAKKYSELVSLAIDEIEIDTNNKTAQDMF